MNSENQKAEGAGLQGATAGTRAGASMHARSRPLLRRSLAQITGEMVWLLSQSPRHKRLQLADLEWLAITPIILRQFRIFYAKNRPLGVALWARVSDEVEKRLTEGNSRLAPKDWKSGETLWLVDIVAPFGGQEAMLRELKRRVFPNQPIKLMMLAEGKKVVRSI